MNRKTLGTLGALIAMSQIAENMNADIYDDRGKYQKKGKAEFIDAIPVTSPIPKGAKEYWFNDEGQFWDGCGENSNAVKIRKDNVVFFTIAINDKSAKKKFEKFKSQQH